MNASETLSRIPAPLKALPNWVAWKLVKKGNEDSKVPFVVGTDKHASSTDPSTWTDFSTAIANTALSSTGGVGFVIGGDAVEEQIVGFDIDGCRNPATGDIAQWAERIIECLDSYTEITPSGTGVRVWVRGKLPGKDRVFNLDSAVGYGGKVKIEVFDSARYFTVTGDTYYEEAVDIEHRDLSEAYELCRETKKTYPAKSDSASPGMVDADAGLEAGTQIKRTSMVVTDKYELLMRGTIISSKPFVIEDGYGNRLEFPSHSEADLALCTASAQRHGNNADLIFADYEASSLYREKWGNRREYFVGHTIGKAIQTAQKIKSSESVQRTRATNTTNPVSLWERATPFCDIEDVQMEWIIPGLIVKGETTMMTGDFGSFKSYMTYFFADAITEGGMFVRRTAQKHPVLILDRENTKATVSRRRYLVGNLRDKKNVRILGRFTNPPAPEITNAELLDLCRTVHPYIIIDSMQDFHPGKKENDTDDMTQFSLEVNALVDAGAVGALVIHHIPKSGKGKGGKYRGATSIPGGVGGALFVEKVGRLGVKIEGFKTRDDEDSLIELQLAFPNKQEMEDKTGRITYTVTKSGLDRSAELKESILHYVSQHGKEGLSRNKIAKGVGGDRNEVFGVVNALLSEKRLAEPDGGIRVSDEEAKKRTNDVSF